MCPLTAIAAWVALGWTCCRLLRACDWSKMKNINFEVHADDAGHGKRSRASWRVAFARAAAVAQLVLLQSKRMHVVCLYRSVLLRVAPRGTV